VFTRLRQLPLSITGDWRRDASQFVRWLAEYRDALEKKGALTITEAEITASSGIKFPATAVASSDANTLDDYKEGNTWTPTDASGAGLALTVTDATYVKIGRLVVARAFVTYPATASGAAAKIGGFTYSAANRDVCAIRTTGAGGGVIGQILGTTLELFAPGTVAITNANLTGADVVFTAIYQV
jgi:hypothetical protein